MPSFDTHDVSNQVPVYDEINLFDSDRALKGSVAAEGADWGNGDLSAFGAKLGTDKQFHLGHLANKFDPELATFDTRGYRSDQVEFHPSYHHFMSISKEAGIHCGAFDGLANDGRSAKRGVGVIRAAKHYMVSQVEAGHVCPITMTHAVIPTLQIQPDIAQQLLPKLLSRVYDPSFKPIEEKEGITLGMGMTEKQGGTDVRTNSTVASPVKDSGPGKTYTIRGHKWFMSAPMCDGFLVLAQADGGLSVFLVPRFKKDGEINSLHFQRLKRKLGNKSNASSEVEFHDAEGYLLGEEGRGVRNIMTMANYTRLDCALGSAGQMRQALSRAYHHVKHRSVFQKKLIDQPMMTALIADLTLESEAATTLAIRLAGSYEGVSLGDEVDGAIARVLTPVIKYWVTKRAPGFCYEAMECHGGNGYIEDAILARLYRDVPVNSIWEGTGSVMCLDLLRVMSREADAVEVVYGWLREATGQDSCFDKYLDQMGRKLRPGTLQEQNGRWLTESMAMLTAGKLLMERAPSAIAEGYMASRLNIENRSGAYGVLPEGTNARAIIDASLLF